MIFKSLLLAAFLSAFSLEEQTAFAQAGFDSSYFFEGSLVDASSTFEATISGPESYTPRNHEQALLLVGQSYLDLPLNLGQSILTDQSFYMSVDFMVPNVSIDESARILFGNKPWGYETPGFQFQLINEKTEWQPEGVIYLNFNIGGGNATEIAGRFYDIPMDVWHTASFNVDFTTETVTFGFNGRSFTQSLREDINGGIFDPAPFYQSLADRAIRIGAPQQWDPADPIVWELFETTSTFILADTQIDNLRISSPRPPGDANLISVALDQFTDVLTGQSHLDEAAAEALKAQVKNNLYGVDFSDVEGSVRAFVEAHNANKDMLYVPEEGEMRAYDDFPAISRSYLDLGMWMMRSGLTTESAPLAEGMVFQEHVGFPGAVPAGAERVAGGSADVLATYIKDPFYNMGDMQVNGVNELSSYVYRPTGFYAPPGEAVHISVDPGLVNSGLHIRVGAHKYDHSLFKDTNRFPILKVDYRIEAATFDVINPLGGGIYVLVPQNTELGWVEIQVDGAIRSPYFSLRSGHETTMQEWETMRNYAAPLADFESDKYMLTVPAAAIRTFQDPVELLSKWNQILDIFQKVHGRPLERVRAEAFMFDTRTSAEGSYPGGYPVTPGLWSQIDGDIKKGSFSPFAVLNPGVWEENEGFYALTHEMAHHHFGYNMPGERETFVNVPFAAILNSVFEYDLEYSLANSTYQRFSRTDAAVDWMVTTNFRNGDPIGMDPTTDFQPEELAYQSRGSAKYLDLADIFGGWDALEAINKTFYEEDVAAGVPVTYTSQPEVSRDHFLENGSQALGCNLGSMFHFWGIHPSTSLATQLTSLPPCEGALERVKTYLGVAPRTNEDLRAFHAEKTKTDIYQLKAHIYEPLMETFDEVSGQQIRNVGAQILSTYFGVNPDEAPSKPILQTTEFSILGNPTDIVTFSWSPSIDPENESLAYSWKLYDLETGATLISRSWVEGSSVDIEVADLSQALSPYQAVTDWAGLGQSVTTSDLFTVVTSDPLISYFQMGVGTDSEKGEVPNEFVLSPAYPNPFNPVTTVSYSIPVASQVSILVYDALGRKVSQLVDNSYQAAGTYRASLNANGLSSGLYLISMRAGSFFETRTVTLIK